MICCIKLGYSIIRQNSTLRFIAHFMKETGMNLSLKQISCRFDKLTLTIANRLLFIATCFILCQFFCFLFVWSLIVFTSPNLTVVWNLMNKQIIKDPYKMTFYCAILSVGLKKAKLKKNHISLTTFAENLETLIISCLVFY